MKSNEINNLMNKFINSEMNCIFINGRWGVGKTFNICKFVEENKKNKSLKFGYCSLFGKNSLDEINTELYQIFHPSKKILNIISSAIKLINVGYVTPINLSINLDGGQENFIDGIKIRNNPKKKYIVILDDFERMSEKITSNDLLGYISNLISQGFKVIIVGALHESERLIGKYEVEIDKDKKYIVSGINWDNNVLGKYKEKVIDREYYINETDQEIMKNILGDDWKYVTDDLIKDFKDNIRNIKKIKTLFDQIKDYITVHNYSDLDYPNIFRICIQTVLTCNIENAANEQKDMEEKTLWDFENSIIEKIRKKLDDIKTKGDLIYAVYNIYTSEDFSLLDNIYNPKSDPLFDSVFFCSDKHKINLIKQQLDYIMNLKNTPKDDTTINRFIRDWYCYAHYLDLSFIKKEKLFTKLNELGIELSNFGSGQQEYIDFLSEYDKFVKNEVKFEIEKSLKTNNQKLLRDKLYELDHMYLDDKDEETINYIKKIFIRNDFYLQNMAGDMEPIAWDINHCVCKFIGNKLPDLKKNLLQKLNSIKNKNKNDKSCNERIDYLINSYKLKI